MARTMCPLTDLPVDLVADILGRLNGTTVASVSCTCCELRDAASYKELWRRACHTLWPSTAILGCDSLIPDFKRFYGESYPLVFYGRDQGQNKETAPTPGTNIPEKGASKFQDFTSLVDVYYKRRCILSRASTPIPEDKTGRAGDMLVNIDGHNTWFLNCPFQWDILEFTQSDSTTNSYDNSSAEQNTYLRNGRTGELEEDLRLSWVLLDKKTGKGVNLSGWAPISSERNWTSEGGKYRVHFGCILPVEGSLFLHGMVKCKIAVSCRLTDGVRPLELEEISLHIEDLTGKHLNGKESLIVLDQALLCLRSTDKIKVKEGFSHYEAKKRELTNQNRIKERVAIGFFTFIQVTAFIALVCVLTSRFT